MANKRRLIDSAELIAKLPVVENDIQISLIGAVADVVCMISECTPVDAVEVCYCKDCKYWEKQKDSAQGCCLLSGNYPTGGWYCANGERRCEDADD